MKESHLAVVGALLLLMAGEARAECAWVLWGQNLSIKGLEWSIVSASPDRNECERKRAEWLAGVRAVAPGYKMDAEGDIRRLTAPDGSQTLYSRICLPDTADPRDPKAK